MWLEWRPISCKHNGLMVGFASSEWAVLLVGQARCFMPDIFECPHPSPWRVDQAFPEYLAYPTWGGGGCVPAISKWWVPLSNVGVGPEWVGGFEGKC